MCHIRCSLPNATRLYLTPLCLSSERNSDTAKEIRLLVAGAYSDVFFYMQPSAMPCHNMHAGRTLGILTTYRTTSQVPSFVCRIIQVRALLTSGCTTYKCVHYLQVGALLTSGCTTYKCVHYLQVRALLIGLFITAQLISVFAQTLLQALN